MKSRGYWSFSLLISLPLLLILATASNVSPPQKASEEVSQQLWAAFLERTRNTPKQGLAVLFTPTLDSAYIDPSGDRAVLWLALVDHTGNMLKTEPGLVLAVRNQENWQVVFPGDARWEEVILEMPLGMIPLEHQPAESSNISSQIEALTGYYLPYVAGTLHRLEGSVVHFHDYPELGYPSCPIETCRYAYDFTDSGHFPLVASKAGVVVSSRDSCADGNSYCTNYILLRNAETNTYQIYLHLANNTIPNKLTNGTSVVRGQYLGDTDDTGYSTSEHVHFMVTSDFWYGSDGYPWGHSVDIRFADVNINSGIPRTCYEVTHLPIYDGAVSCLGNPGIPTSPSNDWFVSGNIGAYPPSGSLTRPQANATINSGTNPLFDVTAQTTDDVRVKMAVLMAYINDQWIEIGPRVSNPDVSGIFDWDVNLCEVGALNGPLEIALKLWDHEGNVVSMLSKRTVYVDHACPPASSSLTQPTTFDATAFKLNWTAEALYAPIDHFELQWRFEATAWDSARTITVGAQDRSTWFVGSPGENLEFRIRAVDTNDQLEAWPSGEDAEVTVNLPANCLPDTLEEDDSVVTAKNVSLGVNSPRNICGADDLDWMLLQTGGKRYYYLKVNALSELAAIRLSAYAPDGTTLLGSADPQDLGLPTHIFVDAKDHASFYILAQAARTNLSGTEVLYTLEIKEASPMFLPLMLK